MNKFILLCLISLFCAPLLRAASPDERSEELLDSYYRPSPKDLTKAYPKWPQENPFPPGKSNINPKASLPIAAKVIAALEVVFPDATFVTVGRDTDYFADILETYLKLKKQPERLIRLGISRPSIPKGLYFDAAQTHAEGEKWRFRKPGYERMQALLKTNGIDPGKPGAVKSIVVLDSTSYAEESQVKTIIQALYRQYIDRGGDPKDIARRITAVNIDGNQRGYQYSDPANHAALEEKGFDLENFFTKTEKTMTMQGPKAILDIDGKKLLYTQAWHESYGPMKIDKKGKATVLHYGFAEREQQIAILHDLFETINEVSKSSFMKMIEAEKKRFVSFISTSKGKGKRGCNVKYSGLR